jgi:hypothetical protein
MRVPVLGTDHVHDPGGALPGPYLVRDLPVPAGFRAAVAVEGVESFTVHRRAFPWAVDKSNRHM